MRYPDSISRMKSFDALTERSPPSHVGSTVAIGSIPSTVRQNTQNRLQFV